MSKLCCVCLEDDDYKMAFRCVTCAGGCVCYVCMRGIDRGGSIFEDSLEGVEESIRCPCCRSLNWKYHFDMIVSVTLGMDLADYDDDNYPPAIKLYVKNQLMAERE